MEQHRLPNNNDGVCSVCANKEAKDNKYMNKRNEVCVENSDVNSDLMNLNGNLNGKNLLDIELDMNELLGLCNMALHPWVCQALLTIVTKLEKESMIRRSKSQNEEALEPKKSYAEAVLNTKTNLKSNERRKEVVTRIIPMIINSQSIREEKRAKYNQSTQTSGNTFSYANPHLMINENNIRHRMKEQKGQHKIVLIGDSHIKSLSSELRQKLGDTCDIMGFVKPNASVSELVSTTREELNKLTKNDVLVFWGGANDVSKNNAAKGFTQEINYLRRNQQTNCIVITVPHRFDLDDNSRVNTEVKMYNRKLIKVAKHLNRVTLVSTVTERKFFT
jgi:hypothetical protein